MNSNMHVKIEDQRGLVKDTSSGALLNTRKEDAEAYKAKKAALVAKRKTEETEDRLDRLEASLEEIKELLSRAIK
jgi:hypothetical protein